MKEEQNDFDFNIGHITKSPCLTCKKRIKFPQCIDSCGVLDKIRTILSKGISSSYSQES